MTMRELVDWISRFPLIPVPIDNSPPLPDEPIVWGRGEETDVGITEVTGAYPELYVRRQIPGTDLAKKIWVALMTPEEFEQWRP